MKLKIILCAVVAMACPVFAADGDLKPVKTELDNEFALVQPLKTENFRTVAADSGTVSDKARMALFVIDGRVINVAVDASSTDAHQPDCVRIDFTGEGNFTNAVVLPMETKEKQGLTQAYFGPKMVDVKVGEETVPVTIQGIYVKSGSYRAMELLLVAALEGKCKVGDKTYPVRLYDGNANLAFGDELAPLKQTIVEGVFIRPGDMLVLDTGKGKFADKESLVSAGYGQPLCLGDKMYQVDLSKDKSKLTATLMDAKPGSVTIDHADWSAVLVGDKHVLYLNGGDKPIAAPADKYKVFQYTETKDKWRISRGTGKKIFEVTSGGTLKMEVGSPLTAKTKVVKEGRTISVSSPVLVDASGEKVEITGPDGVPEPVIEIYNEAGKAIQTGKFQYG